MTKLKLLDPTVDIVFQMLFSSADDTAGLKSLLGALLAPTSIISLELFSPQRFAASVAGKKTRFDIFVKVNGTDYVNLEMQKVWHPSQYGRSLYYWSVVFREQLPSGPDGDYKNLKVARSIFIGPGQLWETHDDPRMHVRYRVTDIDHPERPEILPALFGIDIIDTEKASEMSYQEATNKALYVWAKFFGDPADSIVEEFAMTDLGMERTLSKLKKLSAEQEHWAAVQERMNEAAQYFDKLDVWNDGVAEGRQEGIAEGFEQGMEKGIEKGIEKGRIEERRKVEATWRQMIHLLMSLPNFAAAGAQEIAAHTGIEVDFVSRVMADRAAKAEKPT